MRKFRLFSLLCLMMLGACASKPEPQLQVFPPPPNWYTNPEPNSEQWLIGVASGSNMEQAVQAALEDLLGRISLNIESSYQSTTMLSRYGSRQEAVHSVKTEITKTTVENYQIHYSTQLGFREYAAQVAVKRADFIAQQRRQLDSQLNQLQQHLQQARSSNGIVIEQQAQYVSQQSWKLHNNIIILDSLDKSFDPQPYLNRIQNFANQQQLARKNLQFTLYNQQASQQLLDIFKQAMIQRGYAVTSSNLREGAFRVYLSNSSQRSSSQGFQIVRSTVNIRVVDHRNQQVGANQIQLTGHASRGYQLAEQDALSKLNQIIEQQGLFGALGINTEL